MTALQAQIGKARIKVEDWKRHVAGREMWFTDERMALVAGHNSQGQTMYAKYKKKEMVYKRDKSTLEDHLTELGRELKARSMGYSLGGTRRGSRWPWVVSHPTWRRGRGSSSSLMFSLPPLERTNNRGHRIKD